MSENKPAAAMLGIKVVPGASQNRIVGRYGDSIKVRIAAPPEAGKANEAVQRLLADALGVQISQILLLRGHAQPKKVLQINGLTPVELENRLKKLLRT